MVDSGTQSLPIKIAFFGVKKNTWKNMPIGYPNAALMFGEMVEIPYTGSEVIMDNIILFDLLLAELLYCLEVLCQIMIHYYSP